ncbi:MAG: hypothetical protein ABIL09_13810 [Gemmatimonadota bacterium]
MAQPTFSMIQPGDALNASTWNTAFSDIVAQSTNIQAENIRDEAFDRRSIPAASILTTHTQTDIGDHVAYSYGTAGGPSVVFTAWTVVGPPGTPLREDNGGAGWSFDPTSQMGIVRCSIDVRRVYASIGILNENITWFQLWRSIGGVASAMSSTLRGLEYRGLAATHTHQALDLTIATALWEAGDYDWIELRAAANGAGTYLNANEWTYMSEGSLSVQIWDF